MGTVKIGPWQLVQQTTVPTQAEAQPLDFETTLSELSRNSEFVQAEDSELNDINILVACAAQAGSRNVQGTLEEEEEEDYKLWPALTIKAGSSVSTCDCGRKKAYQISLADWFRSLCFIFLRSHLTGLAFFSVCPIEAQAATEGF